MATGGRGSGRPAHPSAGSGMPRSEPSGATVAVQAAGLPGPAQFRSAGPSLWDRPVALVVFLRGINVGGHRAFRPTLLAEQLRHLGAVSIGATGTLVIRKRVSR